MRQFLNRVLQHALRAFADVGWMLGGHPQGMGLMPAQYLKLRRDVRNQARKTAGSRTPAGKK